MIKLLLKELKETWGYSTEELNDIREKMEELAYASYWEGHSEAKAEGSFVSYGKPEDFE